MNPCGLELPRHGDPVQPTAHWPLLHLHEFLPLSTVAAQLAYRLVSAFVTALTVCT